MKTSFSGKTVALLTIPLILLLMVATLFGIFDPGTYKAETLYYAVQGIGQDVVTLFFVVPLLVLVTWFAGKGGIRAWYLWSGIQFYIAYSYVIYAFSCHFNQLFLVYCGILGLSVYSLLYFFSRVVSHSGTLPVQEKIPFRTTAWFLLLITVVFYALWLSEIIPSLISGETPASIVDSGLIVNAVHVLDISICLPALAITALLLLRKHPLGVALAPAMLVFCVLMAVAIVGMVIAMMMKGLEADPMVSLIMFVLAIISLIVLLRYMKRLKLSTE